MDQAKFNILDIQCGWRTEFYAAVLHFICTEDLKIKRINTEWFGALIANRHGLFESVGLIKIFCGKKKLNKVIREINLLGLQDNIIIF